MNAFISELAMINEQISALVVKRNTLVSDSSEKILTAVMKMMDWSKSDIKRSRVEWNSFERAVMIDITLKNDPSARYVFVFKDCKVSLRFREDFSKHC